MTANTIPWPRRAVIITGDDFGLSSALNQAIALAHRKGVLSCASLMVGAPACSEAVALGRELPDLCLGLHLTLIQGHAVLPPRFIPHLADQAGNFRTDPVGAGLRFFFSLRLQNEIRRELAAQIEAFLSTGLTPWFINGHLNIHLHPRVWPMVQELAQEYNIPGVRLTHENLRITLALNRQRPAHKIAHALIFIWLARRVQRTARNSGFKVNDHLFGLLNDGQMDEDYLLRLLPQLRAGVTEIYSHPALWSDKELRRWMPSYRHQDELAALLSPRIRQALVENGLELTNYQHF
ncbi:MAG: hopanoid biosynthesis-associated protein HpnK [Deltaproteobacteria bacterium]|nr:hopanoid biosynthesis-associated protein HpnK [Deltaproteobacteria bacterium]MBW2134486.1 hopanoid biosynthesis-associated protein HpnK [Deltaproteobacteria bacterium]